MKNWRKGSALLLVGMMVMTGLVAFSAPVLADQEIKEDWLELVFNDATQVDGEPSPYTDRVFDRQNTWNEYRPGEGDGVRDWMTVGASENDLNVQINVLDVNCQFLYINITGAENPEWWDFDDFGDTTTPDAFPVAGYYNAAPGVGTITAQWTFDILVTDFIGYSDETEITCSYSYWDNTAPALRTGSFEIYIYLSTLYDNSGSTEAHVATLPDLMETQPGDADTFFEAGDSFVATTLTLPNHLGESVSDMWLNITPPAASGITLAAGGTAWFPGTLNGGGNTQVFNYRTNVAAGTAPGVYEGTAVLEYTTEEGLRITEPAAPVSWNVDFSFKDQDPGDPTLAWSEFQCLATNVTVTEMDTRQVDYVSPYDIPTIEQSTYTDRMIQLNITILNNGNCPLYAVEFELDPTAGGGWDYFRNPRFFWEDINFGTPALDTLSDTFDLAVGASIDFTIEVIVVSDVPIGEHRLPILYRGYYFDDGSLGTATGFFQTNGGNDLEVIISIMVTDSVIACHVGDITVGTVGDKLNLVAEDITVTLVNDEGYAFIDIIVRANFTGTPWYMPVIGMSDPWVWANAANPASPEPAWGAAVAGVGDEIDVTFTVDTDPSMTPDRYPFQLEITAVIEETLEVVTVIVDYTQGAVIDYVGFGPDIYITAFAGDDEIVPGEDFTLTLTLENQGDDTLRNVIIMIDADDTVEYDWILEQSFKAQFDWTEVFSHWGGTAGGEAGGVTWDNSDFPSEMFYTMESLDVDNVREIVEINLYMDGVYSDPGARIVAIRILDLAPGASTDVVFDMYADKDLVNGKPYAFNVNIQGIDSEGNLYGGPLGLGVDRTISVMSSLPGSSYNPVELDWFDAGIKALGLFLFFVIVLAILLFVYNMFKGDSYDEDEEDFDFEEDEEPDFEAPDEPAPVEEAPEVPEAPEPEPAAEELVEP